jgi:D-beta-D-heptose 7-phosphate kinase/D-beta-D-heptose 1-phosphate adenosyltransferase
MTIVAISGVFDLLHPGHIEILTYARSLGDKLIVLTPKHTYKDIGRPLLDANERKIILENLKPVDEVIIFDENIPHKALLTLKPDIYVKDSRYKHSLPEQKTVESYGGKVVFYKRNRKYSSSSILDNYRTDHEETYGW